MPNRHYEYAWKCSTKNVSPQEPKCPKCGEAGRFVGWRRDAQSHWAHLVRDLGLNPFRSKPGFQEIPGLRVPCRACGGSGYRPQESQPDFCLVCEGSGGFWNTSEERLAEVYRRLDEEAPDARVANCPPGFPLVELSVFYGSHDGGGGPAPSFEEGLVGGLVEAVASAQPPEPRRNNASSMPVCRSSIAASPSRTRRSRP